MTYRLVEDLRAIYRGFPEEDVNDWPHFPCPTCKRGSLTLQKGSLVKEESANISERDRYSHPGRYGEFQCSLRCRNFSCAVVRVTGEWITGESVDERGNFILHDHLHPRFFAPALPLLESRDACPEVVQDRIDAAAKVLWADPSSAANRLRSVIEAVMDDHGIPKKGKNKYGKIVNIDLDARIRNLKKAKPEYASAVDPLLAVKQIGNVGSHGDSLRIPDVLDGVEILDFTLSEIYEDVKGKVNRMVAEIKTRKGDPVKLEVEIEDLSS